MKRTLGLILLSLLWITNVQAAENKLPFVVQDIKLEGLERVDPSIVFRNFPIDIGDQLDQTSLAVATRDLFQSGYFDDVKVLRDGDNLVLQLHERPAIALIRLDGNKQIKDEQLKEGLQQSGLREGDVFRRSALDKIEQELVSLYVGQGRYGAKVSTDVEQLTGNRVALNININEGTEAIIQHINIVGNKSYSNEELEKLFSLKLPNFWSFYTKSDRYSREKMSGDLERLRSFYMDRGYINFKIDSAQVSITPDKKEVFITVNITEGERYTIKDISIAGDMVVAESELRKDLRMKEGDIFSRKAMTDSKDALVRTLGNEGYMFANVSPVPQLDDSDKSVSLRYYIEPGKRTYVRRINIKGNTLTEDRVIRRYMVQMEGGLATTDAIERSKERLDRTGYFKTVNVETLPVAGSDDQVDLEYTVEESQLGQVTASVGISDSDGLIYQLGVEQDNFLGTGNKVGFNFTNSSTLTEYSFSSTNPFYTMDGVSRGYSVYYRKRDYDDDDISSYTADEAGASVNYGYPINEYERLRFGLGIESTDIKTYDDTAQIVKDFLDDNGSSYFTYKVTAGWSDNHLNKGFFSTDGYSQGIDLELGLPGSDLPYYKLEYNAKWYHPFDEEKDWVAGLRGSLGYADALSSTDPYPFFKNYYAGGLKSVRGFSNNSLGPRDDNDDPFGGNVKVTGSAEFIMPTPFVDDQSSWRTLAFFDFGNVYSTNCVSSQNDCNDNIDLGDLRYSVGLGLSWITPVGPLSVSIGHALNAEDSDDTETFQFSLGQTF